MKIIKIIYWGIVMCIAIPLDIIFWNLMFGQSFGFRSPRQCLNDNIKKYKNEILNF